MKGLVDDELEAEFRRSVRAFAEERVAPLVRPMDVAGEIDAGLLGELFSAGLMGIPIPAEHGGAGASFACAIIAIEELAAVDPAVSIVVDVQNTLVARALLRWGSAAQRERYLPRLARDTVSSFALSESGSGSDAFALRTRARRHGDGFVLDGSKHWITNGAEAGLFLLFANLDPERGYRGITAFLVEAGTPGLSIGRREDKLGIRASSTVPLHLEGVSVEADAVLGEAGRGYRIAIELLNEGRIGIAAQMLGLARAALTLARDHVRAREQFGRKLIEFQGIRFEYADLATELEAARCLTYQAMRAAQAGGEFAAAAAMAKMYSARAAQRIASAALEMHGGIGVSSEHGIEKLYRDVKVGSIYEGTTNMQRETIARLLLAPPQTRNG